MKLHVKKSIIYTISPLVVTLNKLFTIETNDIYINMYNADWCKEYASKYWKLIDGSWQAKSDTATQG